MNAEKNRFSRSNQFHDALKRGAKGYDSEGKNLTLNQQTGFKPASSTFANLSTPSNQELNSLVKKDGPKKGIHSSKGYGINKILGDLDKSGDLSAYEAKRQAAIEKNMSEGSTKKGYKH